MTISILAMVLALAEVPIDVSPADLGRRTDLIGREVVVDGRVAYFQSHEGVFDELFLKKSPVPFRLPEDLQSRRNPEGPSARVQGVLRKRENGSLAVDVTNLRMLPSDVDRLKQGVANLAAGDADGRAAWARWARFRAAEYGETALLDRARDLDAEAIRIEASKPGGDTPSGAFRLAKKARDLGIPEPEPSALAHRAFRLRLAEASTSAELDALVTEVESLLPDAKASASEADLVAWQQPYRGDPAAAYRLAPSRARAALDHQLWADVAAASLDRQAIEKPDSGLAIADAARSRLPERPQLADRIESEAMARATAEDALSQLKRDEIENLATRMSRRGQLDGANSLKRRWLEDQRRKRLRPGDAEGRVLLAGQYEAILDDRDSAISLLREAWAIDPTSKVTADAFRRLGFRKVGDEWTRSGQDTPSKTPDRTPTAKGAESKGDDLSGDALRNLTRQEVRAKLGEPARMIRSATQAGVLEQWVFPGTRRTQYVNFFYRPGMPQPLVQRSYSIVTP